MFSSVISRALSTGVEQVVVMGGGLMGTGIAQVVMIQYCTDVSHLCRVLGGSPDQALRHPGGPGPEHPLHCSEEV